MYIIIVGAGKISTYLAELLLDENHDPVIVEKDKDLCQKVSNDLDIEVVNGDATEPDVLKRAGIEQADAIVSLTGKDETNMVISLIAKELGAKQIAARIEKVQYDERVLEKLGIDIVIHPEAAAAGYIEELITKPEVLDLVFLSKGDAEIMELKLKQNSPFIGKKISEINIPKNSSIVAIREEKELLIPDKDTVLNQDSKILVLAKSGASEEVRKFFA
ncbi:MAG TPA: NAD-binding protein [archaeon]|nr:NAD-binding protein [archaeon]